MRCSGLEAGETLRKNKKHTFFLVLVFPLFSLLSLIFLWVFTKGRMSKHTSTYPQKLQKSFPCLSLFTPDFLGSSESDVLDGRSYDSA